MNIGKLIIALIGTALIVGALLLYAGYEFPPINPPLQPFNVDEYVEAEEGQLNQYVLTRTSLEASGGKYVETPDEPPQLTIGPWDDLGIMKYTFDIPYTQEYYLWINVLWSDPEGDSYAIGWDIEVDLNNPEHWWDDSHIWTDSQYGTWHWISRSTPLTTGTHNLIFQTREDGVALDVIYLSTTPTFEPF